MGVKGLWTLLEPVGRRIPAEALGGKRLAVDASIWLVQFLKAMRDERGEPLPHAHLLGFFRRVCKLLFLGVRPVFVFDGSTPELKRQTTAARRRGARNAGAQARRAAEKLLASGAFVKAEKLLDAEIEKGNERKLGEMTECPAPAPWMSAGVEEQFRSMGMPIG